MNIETRDRAFDRLIVIDIKNKDRLESILSDIPRKDVRKSFKSKEGILTYVLNIKKQELLMIKLSLPVTSIEKIRPRKKTYKPMRF